MNKSDFSVIQFSDVWCCFFPKNEWAYYRYLGCINFLYRKGTQEYFIVKDLVKFIEKKAKPFWCPRFVLRLLHLYGNDNSIVRCRNPILSRWHRMLLGGIYITDMKTNWDSYDVRVYGTFTHEIHKEIYKVEIELDKLRAK